MSLWNRLAAQGSTAQSPHGLHTIRQAPDLDGFEQLRVSLLTQVSKLKAEVETILKRIEQIGTRGDSPGLRKTLNDRVGSARDIASTIGRDLKFIARQATRPQQISAFSETFRKAFTVSIALERALNVSLKRQKDVASVQALASTADALASEVESSLTRIRGVLKQFQVPPPSTFPTTPVPTDSRAEAEPGPPATDFEDGGFHGLRKSLVLDIYEIQTCSRDILRCARQLGRSADDGSVYERMANLIEVTCGTIQHALDYAKTLSTYQSKSPRHKAAFDETTQDLRQALQTFRKVQQAGSDRQCDVLELQYHDLMSAELGRMQAEVNFLANSWGVADFLGDPCIEHQQTSASTLDGDTLRNRTNELARVAAELRRIPRDQRIRINLRSVLHFIIAVIVVILAIRP